MSQSSSCRSAALRRRILAAAAALPARLVRTPELTRFRNQNRGTVALIFAAALVPLILAVGSAVDYGYALVAKTKLDAAADAAVLAAVNSSALASTDAEAKDTVLAMFNAQHAVNGVTLDDVDAEVTDNVTGRTAVINYAAAVPTAFMGLVGIQTVEITGSATAVSALPAYVDFYLLLDNTPSMGVGATTADIDTLVANTPDKCAFACHETSKSPNDYYGLAKKLGAKMRIDVMRTATQQLMDTAAQTATVPKQYRAAIYTFGSSCTDLKLSTIAELTADLSSAKKAAAKIDLMTIPNQGYANDQCTNSDVTLTALDDKIPAPGDGVVPAKAQKFLFLVTDGVADANNPFSCSKPLTGGTRCQEPMDVSICSTIKDRGIKIAVLYTTYLPLPTNAWYNSWIAPFQSQIAANVESCASPGLYFEVSPTQGIPEAMTALFKKTVAMARLTK